MSTLISLYIWIVGSIYFLFFLLFALICSFLLPVSVYDPWLKKMLQFLFVLIGTKVKVEGLNNLKPDTTYLFMANHVSLFDIPLLGGFVPGIVRGVEAKRPNHWSLYNLVQRRLGNVPIERENIHRSVTSIRRTINILNSGRSMIILPEGHRSMDGVMKPFKKLPFFLAKQTNNNLVPVGLSGLFELKPKGVRKIKPTTIKICFGEVISQEKQDSLSVLELRDYMAKEIAKLIEKP